MQKDFDNWNEKKKNINEAGESKLYHARELWWCSLGMNVGSEEDGTGKEYERPILILKGLGPKICIVLPLTTSKSRHPMRVPIGTIDSAGKENSVIISQIKVIDTKRLIDRIGFLDTEKFEEVRKTIKGIL
jgi:mRNA interferase MazF